MRGRSDVLGALGVAGMAAASLQECMTVSLAWLPPPQPQLIHIRHARVRAPLRLDLSASPVRAVAGRSRQPLRLRLRSSRGGQPTKHRIRSDRQHESSRGTRSATATKTRRARSGPHRVLELLHDDRLRLLRRAERAAAPAEPQDDSAVRRSFGRQQREGVAEGGEQGQLVDAVGSSHASG